jgi:hypothetical protein
MTGCMSHKLHLSVEQFGYVLAQKIVRRSTIWHRLMHILVKLTCVRHECAIFAIIIITVKHAVVAPIHLNLILISRISLGDACTILIN